jgi:hypothetical protein
MTAFVLGSTGYICLLIQPHIVEPVSSASDANITEREGTVYYGHRLCEISIDFITLLPNCRMHNKRYKYIVVMVTGSHRGPMMRFEGRGCWPCHSIH